MTYKMIEKNYDKGLWNEKMVAVAMGKGIITQEQYESIVGKERLVSNIEYESFALKSNFI